MNFAKKPKNYNKAFLLWFAYIWMQTPFQREQQIFRSQLSTLCLWLLHSDENHDFKPSSAFFCFRPVLFPSITFANNYRCSSLLASSHRRFVSISYFMQSGFCYCWKGAICFNFMRRHFKPATQKNLIVFCLFKRGLGCFAVLQRGATVSPNELNTGINIKCAKKIKR